jgi:hypothetical protein
MINLKKTFFALLFAGACLSAHSADTTTFPVGRYGKFEYNSESGDLLGVELQVIRGRSGYFVLFQVAQGEREDPVLVPAKVSGATIEMVIPDGVSGYAGGLKATLKGKVLEAQFSNGRLSPSGEKVFVLKRR